MYERKKLSDILAQGNGGGNWINGNWGDTPPAPEFGRSHRGPTRPT